MNPREDDENTSRAPTGVKEARGNEEITESREGSKVTVLRSGNSRPWYELSKNIRITDRVSTCVMTVK